MASSENLSLHFRKAHVVPRSHFSKSSEAWGPAGHERLNDVAQRLLHGATAKLPTGCNGLQPTSVLAPSNVLLFLVASLLLLVRHLLLEAMHLFLLAFLLLVVRPGAPSSVLCSY